MKATAILDFHRLQSLHMVFHKSKENGSGMRIRAERYRNRNLNSRYVEPFIYCKGEGERCSMSPETGEVIESDFCNWRRSWRKASEESGDN